MTTTEPEPQPQPEPPESPEPEGAENYNPEGEQPSREAANYRRRLREVEQERDGLRERVESYERREAEAIARDLGAAVPSDLWTLLSLDDLRGDDGALDPEEVRARVSMILTERPTWRRSAPDLGAGPRPPAESERTPGLSALLGKR